MHNSASILMLEMKHQVLHTSTLTRGGKDAQETHTVARPIIESSANHDIFMSTKWQRISIDVSKKRPFSVSNGDIKQGPT